MTDVKIADITTLAFSVLKTTELQTKILHPVMNVIPNYGYTKFQSNIKFSYHRLLEILVTWHGITHLKFSHTDQSLLHFLDLLNSRHPPMFCIKLERDCQLSFLNVLVNWCLKNTMYRKLTLNIYLQAASYILPANKEVHHLERQS